MRSTFKCPTKGSRALDAWIAKEGVMLDWLAEQLDVAEVDLVHWLNGSEVPPEGRRLDIQDYTGIPQGLWLVTLTLSLFEVTQ